MVLTGPVIIALIIIAVALLALLAPGVAGTRPKPPVPTAGRRDRTGQRPDTGAVTS